MHVICKNIYNLGKIFLLVKTYIFRVKKFFTCKNTHFVFKKNLHVKTYILCEKNFFTCKKHTCCIKKIPMCFCFYTCFFLLNTFFYPRRRIRHSQNLSYRQIQIKKKPPYLKFMEKVRHHSVYIH